MRAEATNNTNNASNSDAKNWSTMIEWTAELVKHLPNTQVILRSDSNFKKSVDIFNHAVVSPAHAVVRVTSASDVSTTILFAKMHGLTVSVLAGGHNTSGWSVEGDVIIDLSSMNQVDLHTPDEKTGRVVLEKLQFSQNSGKGKKKRDEAEAFGTDSENASGYGNELVRSVDRANGKTRKYSEGEKMRSEGAEEDASSCTRSAPAWFPHSSNSMDTELSTSGSTSSSLAGRKSGSSSRDHLSDDTGGTSGEVSRAGSGMGAGGAAMRSSDSIDGNGKGKERILEGTENPSEGTRSWLAKQAYSNSSNIPSFASSFRSGQYSPENLASYSASASYSPIAASQSFVGVSCEGFNFNPATLAPSSAGFVFNTAALAPQSTLGTSTLAPTSPPTVVRPLGVASPSTPLPLPFSSTSSAIRATPFFSTSPPNATLASNRAEGSGASSAALPYALVTISTGAKSHEIDNATSKDSYYCPLAAYPVGCAIFASGGFGFLSRLHGLSMDNVVEVEMVLADGRIMYLTEPSTQEPVTAEEKEQCDLWWAFKGAGTALGIVTRLRAKAFKVGLVYSGNLIYPFNPDTTPSLIQFWRDSCKNAPRELYCNLILTAGPDASSHVVVIQICYLGNQGEGEKFLQSIMSWDGERCLLKDVETRTFLEQQDSVKQVLGVQSATRWCVRANLMNTLPDEVIQETVLAFQNIPEKSAWLFEIAAGAIADVDPASSCFPASHRAAPFQVAAIHQWKSPSQDFMWKSSARDWIVNVIGPNSPGGSFPCFLETREGVEQVKGCFGNENWDRLVAIKHKWDPESMFKHTFWPDEA